MSYIKKVALLFILTFIPFSSPLAHEIAGGGSGFLHAITAPEHFINFVALALMGALATSLFDSQAYIYLVCGVVCWASTRGFSPFYWYFVCGRVCCCRYSDNGLCPSSYNWYCEISS